MYSNVNMKLQLTKMLEVKELNDSLLLKLRKHKLHYISKLHVQCFAAYFRPNYLN